MLEPTDDYGWGMLQGASFLSDGRVLVLWVDTAEDAVGLEGPSRSSLYDPQTDTWAEVAPPWDLQGQPPGSLSVVGLADGRALAVFGSSQGDAGARTQSALFNPAQGAWLTPVDLPVADPVTPGELLLLSDGSVLMLGVGVAGTYSFDPATGKWHGGPTLPFDDMSDPGWTVGSGATVLEDGSVIALSRDGHTARLPAGGQAWQRSGTAAVGNDAVVIASSGGAVALGGITWRKGAIHSGPDPRTAVYRGETDRWSPGPDNPWGRESGALAPGSDPAIALLADGRLLAAGGWGGGTDYSCQEGAAILSADATEWGSLQPMPACLGFGIGQLRADRTVLLVGEGDAIIGGVYVGIGIVVLSYLP